MLNERINIKDYLLYDFLYVKFCAELNYGDEKLINGCLGMSGMENIKCKEIRWKFSGQLKCAIL